MPWFYPAVAFAVYTGARRGEALALRWSDANLDKGSVTIARSITEQMEIKSPKNDRTRTVSVPDKLCAILKSHRAEQAKGRLALGAAYKDEDLVFPHADGSPVDPWNFGRAVIDCIKRAKVTPITLHGLRDTHASLCAKAGVPLEVVSQRLGHASIGIPPSGTYTFTQTETPTRLEPSRGWWARESKGSVAFLLHGASGIAKNSYRIRTNFIAPAGFEPSPSGPGRSLVNSERPIL